MNIYKPIFDIDRKPLHHRALYSDCGETVTYGKLKQLIAETGNIFPARGLLFCMCRNEPGSAAGYVCAVENGIVPLLLDADLKTEQLERFLSVYRPAYIWAPAEWGFCHKKYVKEKIYETLDYGLWKTGQEIYPLYRELGLLLTTSGSTGDPKLVRISRENLRANTVSICEYLNLNDQERPITTLPMQYTYGLSVINSHLLAGACILMTKASYVQADFWDFLEKEKATSFGGVPYTYEILKKIRLFDKKIPSLRMITQAGGKLPVSLQQETAEWCAGQGIEFYIMYGQTEATARMSYLPPEQCLQKPGSIGIAIPGGRFLIADDNGKEMEGPGPVGELVYTGKNVSLGYALQQADLQRGDERHGVLFTGDMATCDEDGFYYIVGRRKRFIKIYGVRVSLDACEETVREKYPDLEVACTGRDDHLQIYLAGREQNEQTARTIASELASILNLSEKAFEGRAVSAIPKNDAGKIRYTELARQERIDGSFTTSVFGGSENKG